MPHCRNCGAQLPEDAMFCPGCGAPVEAKTQPASDIRETAMRYIAIGLVGAFLSVMITSFSGEVNLYFIPSFISSIFIIYVYRINEFKDSIIVTLAVYLLADGILGTIVLGQLYFLNEEYCFRPELWDVMLYPFNPISAFIAAYVGVRISPKRREAPILTPYRKEEGPGGVIYNL